MFGIFRERHDVLFLGQSLDSASRIKCNNIVLCFPLVACPRLDSRGQIHWFKFQVKKFRYKEIKSHAYALIFSYLNFFCTGDLFGSVEQRPYVAKTGNRNKSVIRSETFCSAMNSDKLTTWTTSTRTPGLTFSGISYSVAPSYGKGIILLVTLL